MTDRIEVFTQNSIRIDADGKIIYIDPFKMTDEPKDADFVFITHDHYDHYSPDDIKKVICEKTILIIPEKLESRVNDFSGQISRIVPVKQGTYHVVEDLEFDTIPAYNISKPFHEKSAGGVGYLLILEGKGVYIAGDTDVTPEAEDVDCDIALVPIGGTYTMDAKEAADFINKLQPKVAIPTHYGSIVGSLSDADVFKKNVKFPVKVEIKIKG